MKRILLPLLPLLVGSLALPSPAEAANPTFEAQTIDPNIQIGYGTAIGDVDGDGDLDILVADNRDFLWYENPGWEKRVFHSFHQGEQRETLRDNVCLAARDINGDGKVEVAVGTNWNPGNTMACEDLKIADLNNDGKPDILATGRATKNVVIYWNRSE